MKEGELRGSVLRKFDDVTVGLLHNILSTKRIWRCRTQNLAAHFELGRNRPLQDTMLEKVVIDLGKKIFANDKFT